jgi:hypothetical protein
MGLEAIFFARSFVLLVALIYAALKGHYRNRGV